MKLFYTLLISLFILVPIGAQNIDFSSNPDLKTNLLNYEDPFSSVTIDSNSDGEISINEALATSALHMSLDLLFGENGVIGTTLPLKNTDLDIIKNYFTNLTHLDLSRHELSGIVDLNGLNKLTFVNLDSNYDPNTNLSITEVKFYSEDNNFSDEITISAVNNAITNIEINNPSTTPNPSEPEDFYTLYLDYNQLSGSNWFNSNLFSYQILLLSVSYNPFFDFNNIGCDYLSLGMAGLSNLINNPDLTVCPNLSELWTSNYSNSSTATADFLASLPTQLSYLYTENSQFDNLDLSILPNLEVYASYNEVIESVDLSQNSSLEHLYFSESYVDLLNIKNGSDFVFNDPLYGFADVFGIGFSSYYLGDSFPIVDTSVPYDMAFGDPSLTPGFHDLVICADSGELTEVINHSNASESGVPLNVSTSALCPCTTCSNDISGEFILDTNSDGCDATDPKASTALFTLSDGTSTVISSANSLGAYNGPLADGTYTLTPNIDPALFSVSPPNAVFNLTGGTSSVADFCISPTGVVNDLEIIIIPLVQSRPGFDTSYEIIIKNVGNQSLGGNITFTYDDTVMDFLNASETPSNTPAGSCDWNITPLSPFGSHSIIVYFNLNTPTDSNPLNGGDLLNLSADINTGSTTDIDASNNNFMLADLVVNSYDPNDKKCVEGDIVGTEVIGEYVHYVIRFENTGTADAINIAVKDIIDTSKFDVSTLVPLSGSHAFDTKIENGNEATFYFTNINLPFDDANNDGYVSFKIKTLGSLQVGDTFDNGAEIYFDYNYPIYTNIYSTEISNLAVEDVNASDLEFTIYPNPAKDVVNIETENAIDHITIYDVEGRIIKSIVSPESSINISDLDKGVYLLVIQSNGKTNSQKLIKE